MCVFQVLFADGTVSTSPDSGPVCVLVPHTLIKEEDPIKEMTADTKDKKGSEYHICANKLKTITEKVLRFIYSHTIH